MTTPLKFQRLHDAAQLPTRGSEHAAGYDLYAVESAFLSNGMTTYVRTGIAVEIPPGWCGRVLPRSKLSLDGIVVTGSGLIDSDYRGELFVPMASVIGGGYTQIKPGDRFAQLLILPHFTGGAAWAEGLAESARGQGGFGSTGR